MRKPTLIVLLAASALVTACGGASTDTSNAPAQPAQAPAASTPAPEPAAQPTAQPEMRLETAAAAPTPAPDTSAAKAPAPGVRRAAPPPAPPPEHPTFTQTDLEQGTGAAAAQGKRLTVNYTGWLYDPAEPEQKGRQFDSSVGGQPFEFVLGARRVIRGWDQGFDGMNVGGKRRLVIPPELGYGERGFGNGVIPPNAALVFEMELMEVGE